MMIDITEAYLHFKYPKISEEELKYIAHAVFDITSEAISEFFPNQNLDIDVIIEDGTLKSRGKIYTAAKEFVSKRASNY